jgi:hypothetical protein
MFAPLLIVIIAAPALSYELCPKAFFIKLYICPADFHLGLSAIDPRAVNFALGIPSASCHFKFGAETEVSYNFLSIPMHPSKLLYQFLGSAHRCTGTL